MKLQTNNTIYVEIPKDPAEIKNKIVFNLTLRQILCFLPGAVFGLVGYFLMFKFVGNTAALMFLTFSLIPFFLLGLYKKDGLYLEKYMKYVWLWQKKPKIRPFYAENYWEQLERESKTITMNEGTHD